MSAKRDPVCASTTSRILTSLSLKRNVVNRGLSAADASFRDVTKVWVVSHRRFIPCYAFHVCLKYRTELKRMNSRSLGLEELGKFEREVTRVYVARLEHTSSCEWCRSRVST